MSCVMIKLSAILMFAAVNSEDFSDFVVSPNGPPPVTEECLQCLCQATTGCKQNIKCVADTCGMFSITRPYWVDAGRPTVNGSAEEWKGALSDYSTCASDPECADCINDTECAVRTVRSYMKRYPRDCNKDGYINCFDYMAIHMMGPNNCAGELPLKYGNLFHQCAAAIAAQQR